MAKLFAVEEQVTDIETEILDDDGIDVDLQKLDMSLEDLLSLSKLPNLLDKVNDSSVSQEAITLLINNTVNSLHVANDIGNVSLEDFEEDGGKTGNVVVSKIKDVVGVVVKSFGDLVAAIFDKLETIWNNTVRGYSSIKKKIKDLRERLKDMPDNVTPDIIVNKKISKAYRTIGGRDLVPRELLLILDNHHHVADGVKNFKHAITDLAYRDIARVTTVYKEAESGGNTDDDYIYGPSIVKMNKLTSLLSSNDKLLLGEGRSIIIDIDEEALESYVFQKATLQITTGPHATAYQPERIHLATKHETEQVISRLEGLVESMEGMTDFFMTFNHAFKQAMTHLIGGLVRTAGVGGLVKLVGVRIGFYLLGGHKTTVQNNDNTTPIASNIMTAISLTMDAVVSYFKFVFYSIISIFKFFATKFTNVTFRVMDAGISYVNHSLASGVHV